MNVGGNVFSQVGGRVFSQVGGKVFANVIPAVIIVNSIVLINLESGHGDSNAGHRVPKTRALPG